MTNRIREYEMNDGLDALVQGKLGVSVAQLKRLGFLVAEADGGFEVSISTDGDSFAIRMLGASFRAGDEEARREEAVRRRWLHGAYLAAIGVTIGTAAFLRSVL